MGSGIVEFDDSYSKKFYSKLALLRVLRDMDVIGSRTYSFNWHAVWLKDYMT